jgi:nucleotide-binding universal stress UspA family protein
MPEYRRILAIEDFNDPTHAATRRAIGLARLGGADLALLHLLEPDVGLDGGYPAPSRQEVKRGYEGEALRRLKYLAATLGAADARLIAHYDLSHHGFAETVANWQPDLVVANHDSGHLDGRHDLLILGKQPHWPHGRGLLRLLMQPIRQAIASC